MISLDASRFVPIPKTKTNVIRAFTGMRWHASAFLQVIAICSMIVRVRRFFPPKNAASLSTKQLMHFIRTGHQTLTNKYPSSRAFYTTQTNLATTTRRDERGSSMNWTLSGPRSQACFTSCPLKALRGLHTTIIMTVDENVCLQERGSLTSKSIFL